jgi:hypothetical protein
MLTLRSADVQAGVPGVAAPDAVAAAVAGADAVPVEAVPVWLVVGWVAEEPAAGVDDDDAAHPAASMPAASSGSASNAFFMRAPRDTSDMSKFAVLVAKTPQGRARLGRVADDRIPVLAGTPVTRVGSV